MYNHQNTNIHYTDQGAGPAIVLLHGFTESHAIWDEFVAPLADAFRVVTIDLPGHGQSGMLGEVHTMDDMAGAIKAVLDHLMIGECVLIGHSMGGYAALAFARQHVGRVAGLGLFHSTAAPDSEEARGLRDRAIEVIRKNKQDFLLQFIPSLFAEKNREPLRPLIDRLTGTAAAMPAEAIIAAQEGMKQRADSRDLLREAAYPVLFIAGKQDSRIPIEGILPQLALPKTCYSLILEDAGHMGWAEAPEECLDMLRTFAAACFR